MTRSSTDSFTDSLTDSSHEFAHATASSKPADFLYLALLTIGAMLVAGYHPYVEDAEIYLPGVKKILNPALYPFGGEFFLSHAHMTLFPRVIAWSVRLSHLPFDVAIFLWQLLSIFLLLLACWKLSGVCFRDSRARWCGVALVAVLLTLPVAGTALYIMDQYITSRSLSAFSVLFAIFYAVKKKYVWAALWILFTAAVHPLMSVFGLAYLFFLFFTRTLGGAEKSSVRLAALLLPFGLSLHSPSPAYREAVATRSYFFILQWAWYEWLGIFAPLAILWWISRIARKNHLVTLEQMSRALIPFALSFFALALIITIPDRLLSLAWFQPMRSLYILYILLILFGGGLLAQFVLKNHFWRWALLFLPLCAGMFYVQRQIFPGTVHLELPGRASGNPWVQSFTWIRDNTPTDALFALDPAHMALPGEDQHGFRALAERSRLADRTKDSGAVTMFPDLPVADHWREQVRALDGWNHFQRDDFARLKKLYGVTWVVLPRIAQQRPGVSGLTCPYQNDALLVCRLD